MIFLADNASVGHGAILHGCSIGENTIVGMGSIIMDGSTIGRNTMVAAGSLVSEHKTFPDGVLLMGRPAKVVRELTEEEIAHLRLNAQHYVGKAEKYLQAE
jgi:carbonic anhydrase/acetyltransferase-like protein (isoleucine patch superfamily)